MWQVHCFPLCPFSRKVRLALAEKGVPFELVRANPWEGTDAFFALNPAGRTPVLRNEAKDITLSDSQAICEYFEETEEKAPLIRGTATGRAEIRRLVALFDEQFFSEVTLPLLNERIEEAGLSCAPRPTAGPCAMPCVWRTSTSITSIG